MLNPFISSRPTFYKTSFSRIQFIIFLCFGHLLFMEIEYESRLFFTHKKNPTFFTCKKTTTGGFYYLKKLSMWSGKPKIAMIKSTTFEKNNFTCRNWLFFCYCDSICIQTKSYFKDGRYKQSHILQGAAMQQQKVLIFEI